MNSPKRIPKLRERNRRGLRAFDDRLAISRKRALPRMPWQCGDRRMNRSARRGTSACRARCSPSANSSAITPIRFRFSITVWMRSVSLIRNSDASRTVRPSSVAAPSTASTGISSINAAVTAPETAPPRKVECSTTMSPTNSPFLLSSVGILIFAPMPASKSSSAERVGFNPTPRIVKASPESGARPR